MGWFTKRASEAADTPRAVDDNKTFGYHARTPSGWWFIPIDGKPLIEERPNGTFLIMDDDFVKAVLPFGAEIVAKWTPASAIEARSDATPKSDAAEGESAASETGDAQAPHPLVSDPLDEGDV